MNPRDEEAIRPAVDAIVERFHPDKIILFGSRARGDANENSDFDLLIIGESDQIRWRRAVPVYGVISHLRIPIDVVWWTREEVVDWAGLKNFYLHDALKEGVVLYDADPFGTSDSTLAESRI